MGIIERFFSPRLPNVGPRIPGVSPDGGLCVRGTLPPSGVNTGEGLLNLRPILDALNPADVAGQLACRLQVNTVESGEVGVNRTLLLPFIAQYDGADNITIAPDEYNTQTSNDSSENAANIGLLTTQPNPLVAGGLAIASPPGVNTLVQVTYANAATYVNGAIEICGSTFVPAAQ